MFVSVCSIHTQPKYRAVPKAGSLAPWHHGVVRVESTAPCTTQALFSNELATAMLLPSGTHCLPYSVTLASYGWRNWKEQPAGVVVCAYDWMLCWLNRGSLYGQEGEESEWPRRIALNCKSGCRLTNVKSVPSWWPATLLCCLPPINSVTWYAAFTWFYGSDQFDIPPFSFFFRSFYFPLNLII